MNAHLTEQESLKIIQEMIVTSKNKFKDNSFFFLLWGWLVLIASLSHYFLLMMKYEYAYLPWPILMIGGMIASIIAGIRLGRKTKVISHFDTMIIYLWWGFGITMFVVLLMTGYEKIPWTSTYPLVISLYAFGTFVSGGVLRFKPLIWGGLASWVISVVAFFVTSEQVLLLTALSIFLSYLIPGYLLKKREEK